SSVNSSACPKSTGRRDQFPAASDYLGVMLRSLIVALAVVGCSVEPTPSPKQQPSGSGGFQDSGIGANAGTGGVETGGVPSTGGAAGAAGQAGAGGSAGVTDAGSDVV